MKLKEVCERLDLLECTLEHRLARMDRYWWVHTVLLLVMAGVLMVLVLKFPW